MNIIFCVIWIAVVGFATNQLVEILHHSRAGKVWRTLADAIAPPEDRDGISWLEYVGLGMQCPFCYSNWFAILFMGCGTLFVFSPVTASIMALIGGLAAARMANLLNDYTHDWCRTPNKNENSASQKAQKNLEDVGSDTTG